MSFTDIIKKETARLHPIPLMVDKDIYDQQGCYIAGYSHLSKSEQLAQWAMENDLLFFDDFLNNRFVFRLSNKAREGSNPQT